MSSQALYEQPSSNGSVPQHKSSVEKTCASHLPLTSHPPSAQYNDVVGHTHVKKKCSIVQDFLNLSLNRKGAVASQD